MDGEWLDNPSSVKFEFLLHFKNQFSKPSISPPWILQNFQRRLSLNQSETLDNNVTFDEIKKLVWDCGLDKSSCPDSFPIGFIRRFWYLIKKDFAHVVVELFSSSELPIRCNSSFIALVPKVQDAKNVNYF